MWGICGKGINGLETELILTNHQSGVACSVTCIIYCFHHHCFLIWNENRVS